MNEVALLRSQLEAEKYLADRFFQTALRSVGRLEFHFREASFHDDDKCDGKDLLEDGA